MKSIYRLTAVLLLLTITNLSDAQEVIEVVPEEEVEKSNDSAEVFVFVEVMPEFPGGDEARMKFLRDNIEYPEKAADNGDQGIVYVSFIIEKDGRVTNVKVLRGVSKELDKETIRVVKLMPKWRPGTQRGKAIRAQFNMPVKYELTPRKSEKPLSKKEQKKAAKQKKKEAKAKK